MSLDVLLRTMRLLSAQWEWPSCTRFARNPCPFVERVDGGRGREGPGRSQCSTHAAPPCDQCPACHPCFVSSIHPRVHGEAVTSSCLKECAGKALAASSPNWVTACPHHDDLRGMLSQHFCKMFLGHCPRAAFPLLL